MSLAKTEISINYIQLCDPCGGGFSGTGGNACGISNDLEPSVPTEESVCGHTYRDHQTSLV